MPRNDRDKIRHKRRDLTFQNGGVAADGVFFVDVCFVHLGDDWENEDRGEDQTRKLQTAKPSL